MSVRDKVKIISIILIAVLIADQVTKKLAEAYIINADVMYYFWDMFQIRYAENTGAWGGLGGNLPLWGRIAFLQVIPMIFLVALFVYVVTRDEFGRGDIIAFGLILGGGLGNLIDRALYGYVIDFAYMGIGEFGPPLARFFKDHLFEVTWFDLATLGTNIFNIADVAIMAGTIYILLVAIFRKQPVPESKNSDRDLKASAEANVEQSP